MDTVITRIMAKLTAGNKPDKAVTNAPQRTAADECHGATTRLMLSLESDIDPVAAAPSIPAEAEKPCLDASGEPVHTELVPILTDEQKRKLEEARLDDRVENRHGKKIGDGGGFNPYG